MSAFKCVVVDDEPLAITVLKEYVSRVPSLELSGTYTNPAEAISFIQQERPHILFLDIQMPEIKGIDLLKTFTYKPIVILTTAYSQYAIEGYNLDVVDYLLKPIPFERFLQAVNKATRLLSSETAVISPDGKDFLFVKSGYKSVKINFDDIVYIEGVKEYVAIYTGEQRFLKLDTLKKLESTLPKSKFVRVHKSFIVNMRYVKAYFGNTIELINKSIPIGRAYKDELNQLFR